MKKLENVVFVGMNSVKLTLGGYLSKSLSLMYQQTCLIDKNLLQRTRWKIKFLKILWKRFLIKKMMQLKPKLFYQCSALLKTRKNFPTCVLLHEVRGNRCTYQTSLWRNVTT